MACYIVTFDPTGENAEGTIKGILKGYGTFCPITKYSWAVVTTLTAKQIRDELAQASPASRIFVIRSGTEGAWRNIFGATNSEWLKKYL